MSLQNFLSRLSFISCSSYPPSCYLQEPATFWISNPSNNWTGNVAAGSQSSGFWFELQLRGTRASMFPNLHPKSSPLVDFKNNVAHSNGDVSLVRPMARNHSRSSDVVGLYREGFEHIPMAMYRTRNNTLMAWSSTRIKTKGYSSINLKTLLSPIASSLTTESPLISTEPKESF